jgi:hypothetical protein
MVPTDHLVTYSVAGKCYSLIHLFHPQRFGRRERKKAVSLLLLEVVSQRSQKTGFSRHVVYAAETEVDIAVKEPEGIRNSKEANTIWKILLQICIYFIFHQKNTGT